MVFPPILIASTLLRAQTTVDLNEAILGCVASTKMEFKTLKPEEFAISIWDLNHDKRADYQGDLAFYPASVVKIFWLGFCEHLMEVGKVRLTDELSRGLSDMIRESSNDATGYVVDVCTQTTGGPELKDSDLTKWLDKRNAANRWFAKLGLKGINVNQKTWGDGPYGRERQSYGKNFGNRNALTANATVTLMGLIAQRKLVSPARSDEMLALLKRKNPAEEKTEDAQANEFIGSVLPKGVELYSKAGWTSTTRHDVVYLKFAGNRQIILAVYTKNHANESKIVPFIAQRLLTALKLLD